VTVGWWAEHPMAQIRTAIVMIGATREMRNRFPLVDSICATFLSVTDRRKRIATRSAP